MPVELKVTDYDVVYLSYDEPNAEKNYADLLTKIPWAKRVHGIKGSDSAHKECAKISDTDRLIIVDGDNIIKKEFLNQKIEIDDSVNLEKTVISWAAYNIINGLIYGNGGIKSWPKNLILEMKTHENAESNNSKTQVDFCWDINYLQQSICFSEVHNNSTPKQAWRAGFREGVKMSLIEGSKLADSGKIDQMIHWKNLERLLIWCNVGSDVDNGFWAIYGARLGCYMTNLTDWDYLNVRDFDYLNDLWRDENLDKLDDDKLIKKISDLGRILQANLNLPMSDLDANASMLIKKLYKNPSRNGNFSFIKR